MAVLVAYCFDIERGRKDEEQGWYLEFKMLDFVPLGTLWGNLHACGSMLDPEEAICRYVVGTLSRGSLIKYCKYLYLP